MPKKKLFQRKKKFSKSIPNFENFTEQSSIHGIRYLSKKQNSSFPRIFWTLALIVSFFGLCFNAKRLYIKLNVSPDIGTSVKFELSREVPFPAITICLPLFAKDGMVNFTHYMKEYRDNGNKYALNLTDNEKSYLASNSMRCAQNRLQPIQKCCNNTKVANILQRIEETSPLIDEALAGCSLNLITQNCNKIFKRILTNHGFCYTANMQNINSLMEVDHLSSDLQKYIEYPKDNSNNKYEKQMHWTLDDGYGNSSDTYRIPLRLTKSNTNIVRIIATAADVANFCSLKNIRVQVHLPNEIPTIFHGDFQVEHGHEKRLKLHAKATYAHSSLKSYPPKARGCLFQDEMKLKYFKIYTKYHCYFECLTNNVLVKCGCVSFYMPRNSTVRVCGLRDSLCVHDIIHDWPDFEDLNGRQTPCDCYPTCNDVEYKVSEIDFIYDASVHADRIKNYNESNIYSRIFIIFEDHLIQLNEKFVSYKFQNFIADLGGLLGLFLGCSLLSMVEVLYIICEALKEKYFNENNVKYSGSAKVSPNNDDFLKDMEKISEDVYIIRTPLYKREKL